MTSRSSTLRARSVVLAFVAALLAGSAAGLGAALAGVPADAQGRLSHAQLVKRSLAVWGRVAACESSHEWHINTHNGYYGGVQFLQATWVGFGGRKYARRADLATRRQQIAVARLVLAYQGPTAWPVCGKRAHLNRRNGRASTAALPDLPGYRQWGHGTTPVTKHPVRKHPVRKHPVRNPAKYRHYRVRAGDSLSTIAEHFHVNQGHLWRANRRSVPPDNVILVGQVLRIPHRDY